MRDRYISPQVRETLILMARHMRSNPTQAEAFLWDRIRKRRLDGFKFRRQHIILAFIVDFYCPATRLVVEVEGGIHKVQQVYDRERFLLLDSLGYRVLRFDNEEVENDINGVLAQIRAACHLPQP